MEEEQKKEEEQNEEERKGKFWKKDDEQEFGSKAMVGAEGLALWWQEAQYDLFFWGGVL